MSEVLQTCVGRGGRPGLPQQRTWTASPPDPPPTSARQGSSRALLRADVASEVGGWRERSRTLTVFAPLSPQVHDPDLASVKDKNEAELKKEVKKLQKFRDQVKTW